MAFYVAQPFGEFGGTWVSDQIGQIAGYPAEQFAADIGLWADRLHPDDREEALAAFERILQEDTISVEYRWQTAGGEYRWFLDHAVLVRNEIGEPKQIVGTWLDTTERRRAEEALRESEERYRLLFEGSRDAIMTLAPPSWRFTSGNPATVEMFGAQDEADFVSKAPWDYSPPSQPDGRPSAEEAKEMIKTAMREGSHFFEWQHRRLDGEEFPAMVLLTRFELAGQALLQASVRDISAQRQLEEQLRQSQKLEAIGQLAGGVAHDFNNLLTGIKGYARLAMGQTQAGTSLHSDLEQVSQLSDRAAGLTRQLLAFSRKQALQPEVIDLNHVIGDATKMLGRLIGEHIELEFVPTMPLDRVCADPGQIEQVLMNLAVNARDVMPNGGRLTIETANVDLDEEYVKAHAQAEPGPHVMIAVSDTGCGMDAETQQRIFDPFFTTKEVGKGTGLGLATVYGIVRQHNGYIWVYSEPGEGTAFKIYLPRSGSAVMAARETQDTDARGGSEGVLLVEDDDAVLEVARRHLTEKGYRVLCASCPAEAQGLFARHRDEISLLVTDVVMPGANGRQLYERLAQSSPDLKVIYTSGYTDNAILHHGVLEEGLPFVQKPFDANALAQKVRDVLDAT